MVWGAGCYDVAMKTQRLVLERAPGIRRGRPDIARARALLRRWFETPPDARVKPVTADEAVQMARRTRERIWKQKFATRP